MPIEAKDPGEAPERPGNPPQPGTEEWRAWQLRTSAYGDWVRKARRYRLSEVLKKLKADTFDDADVKESLSILIAIELEGRGPFSW